MTPVSNNLRGVGFLVLAMLIFSLQDIAVKGIGGDYSVMQIVTLRSIVAMPCTLFLFRLEGRRGWPSTPQPRLEYWRGAILFLSYTTHFMGLAALPLAEIAAIKFSGPLMITLLAVFLLGELVGPRRWMALLVGFGGVLLIVQPGTASFNLGSVFILLSVLFYALAVIVTRRLQSTDSGATMAYYSSLVYLVASFALSPLALLIGETPNAHASIAFLLRAWATPSPVDLLIMCSLGLIWAGGMYSMARAYSLAQASVAAPFEYVILPINVMWGYLLWAEIPTWATWAGASLTLLSGLYILHRERQEREECEA